MAHSFIHFYGMHFVSYILYVGMFNSLAGHLLHFDDYDLREAYFLNPEWLAGFIQDIIQPSKKYPNKCENVQCVICSQLPK